MKNFEKAILAYAETLDSYRAFEAFQKHGFCAFIELSVSAYVIGGLKQEYTLMQMLGISMSAARFHTSFLDDATCDIKALLKKEGFEKQLGIIAQYVKTIAESDSLGRSLDNLVNIFNTQIDNSSAIVFLL